MSSTSRFGPSNGQFWFGKYGFLYKKNVGVGGRRTTQFRSSALCNTPQYLYNKYSPGQSGVGAQSVSNRRAKNRLATICSAEKPCGKFYPYLGRYDNYTENPNGYFPYPTEKISAAQYLMNLQESAHYSNTSSITNHYQVS